MNIIKIKNEAFGIVGNFKTVYRTKLLKRSLYCSG